MSLVRLEWRRRWVSPLAWVLLALSAALLAWIFLQGLDSFLHAQAKLAQVPSGFTKAVAVPVLAKLAWLGLLLAPLLSMTTLAGERRQGTLAVLLAAGQSPLRIVCAKFVVVWAWLLVLLVLVLAMPALLAGATQLDYGQLGAAGLGMALFLGALAAIGLACSAGTRYPALAAGAAWLISIGLWVVNMPVRTAGEHGGVLNWLALPSHLQPLLRGLVASADLVYFVLLIATALAIATLRLGRERVLG